MKELKKKWFSIGRNKRIAIIFVAFVTVMAVINYYVAKWIVVPLLSSDWKWGVNINVLYFLGALALILAAAYICERLYFWAAHRGAEKVENS